MGPNKEKYFPVPRTVFKSHYLHSLFGVYYGAGYGANETKARGMNESQKEAMQTGIPCELERHHSAPSRQPGEGSGDKGSSVRAANVCDLPHGTFLFKVPLK